MCKHSFGYALIMAAEHQMGKTKYGSLFGLAIAVLSAMFRKLKRPAEDKNNKENQK